MVAKKMRATRRQPPDVGATTEALNHGAIEIGPLLKGPYRATMVARRVGLHERLYARGKITDSQWNWVCRYVVETEVAAGARLGKPELEPVDAWSGPLIYNRQCAAVAFLRRAHERLTGQERQVLIAACVDCETISEIGLIMGLEWKEDEDAEAFRKRIDGFVRVVCVRIISTASGTLNQKK